MREEISDSYDKLVNSTPTVDQIEEYFHKFAPMYSGSDKYGQIRIIEGMTYLLRSIHRLLGSIAAKIMDNPDDREVLEEERERLAGQFKEVTSFIFEQMNSEEDNHKLSTLVIFSETHRNEIGMDYFGLNPYFMTLHNSLMEKNHKYAELFEQHVDSVRNYKQTK